MGQWNQLSFLQQFMTFNPKMTLSIYHGSEGDCFNYAFAHMGITLEIISGKEMNDFEEINSIVKEADKHIENIKMDVALNLKSLEIRVLNPESVGSYLGNDVYNPCINMTKSISESALMVYAHYTNSLCIIAEERILHWFDNPNELVMDYLCGNVHIKFEEFAIGIEGKKEKMSYRELRETIKKEFGENFGFVINGDLIKVIKWEINKKECE